jgi:coenzyme F420-dependent glucose-6-phosphate dehydrogenase
MKVSFGYWAPQEQYHPMRLLEHAVLAEKHGFDAIWTSDHFQPWTHTNAHCGFPWTFLAVAADRTHRATVGTGVTCPMLRYNPAIVAQAFATLASMYPNRVFLGLGSGEAVNEVPPGCSWPSFKERTERLEEAIKIVRLLWTKSFVSFKGKYHSLNKANLYTKPEKPIPLYLAANGPKVARIAGRDCDGLITVPFFEREYLHDVLFNSTREGAKSAGKDPSKLEFIVDYGVSYDEEYDRALASCRFWKGPILPAVFKYAISDPREIEEYANLIGDDILASKWFIATTPDEHIKNIERLVELGFTKVAIQSSSPDEKKYIRVFGEKVLPYLKERFSE